jgi:DNA-binding XRE family transcriptional regulator
MGRPKKNPKPTQEMLTRAKDWKRFRSSNLMSQKTLSEVAGISRRTIQNVEAARENPQERILELFKKLQSKYAAEGKPIGKKKSKEAA